MRIGELVRRTGVSERLLRYYEEQGLLHPARLPSGYRDYDEAHVEAVHRIRCLLAAGLSTSTIAILLPCVEARAGRLAPTCPEALGRLRAERDRIDQAMHALNESRRALNQVIAAAGPSVWP
ncbi:MerR family transcriptional regulator [Nonomuraea candida]|uniref:MerR family transcriptional regulator n=1 Tax=Nonomuraea candida TaxID=359159 RepID=UPI0005B955C9|nr:MerR family transcriptional regulator [Nonomuraea candida]